MFSSDRITLRLTAPPVDGAANAACRAFLAERLDVAKSRLTILRGETARAKLIRIRDADAAEILGSASLRERVVLRDPQVHALRTSAR